MDREEVNGLLFGTGERRRFTQDTPVLPEVWYSFAERPSERHDLLITPLDTVSANALLLDLAGQLGDAAVEARPVALRGFAAVSLTFEELVRVVLPRTAWARAALVGRQEGRDGSGAALLREPVPTGIARWHDGSGLQRSENPPGRRSNDGGILELLARIGGGAWEPRKGARAIRFDEEADLRDGNGYRDLIAELLAPLPSIWRVALNRPLEMADEQSRGTVKGDAAHRVFDVRCRDFTWAVVDSGIDAEHLAFNDGGMARVVASYDFTILRDLMNVGYRGRAAENPALGAACDWSGTKVEEGARLLEAALRSYETDTLDWASIERLIRIASPRPPADGHGTHVAGVIGANWREDDGSPIVVGMCPDIRLLDLRVVGGSVAETEFAVIAALQFLRNLNTRNQHIAVHGVNLSLSIPHAVENYACGRTPVCEECERLVGAGVVVVAAAGNRGWQALTASTGLPFGYSAVSITDPGNAEAVITVGSTHKREPHAYGVSYFSSRGPTGDGRAKPDLLAPGERIRSTLPRDEYGSLDGTSQAAPHVSGAAALLMARFPELIGQPARIKRLLCDSATDLGRERAFQGHGLLDVLRALQSF